MACSPSGTVETSSDHTSFVLVELTDLLERSIAGLPPQFGQSPLRGADEQTHREVEGLLVAETAASLFRNHPDLIVVVVCLFFLK